MSVSVPVSGDLAAYESQHRPCSEDSELSFVTCYDEPWQEAGDISDDGEVVREDSRGPMDNDSIHLDKTFKKV